MSDIISITYCTLIIWAMTYVIGHELNGFIRLLEVLN